MNTINEERLKYAKSQATRLTTRLKELGVSIKRAQALEGIAAINGHSDWNHYSAALNSPLAPELPNQASAVIAELGGYTFSNLVRKIARTYSYENDFDYTLLSMRSGAGKSTILYHCIADAEARNATCIYFDCYGNNSELPKYIRDKAQFISVTDDVDGIKELIPTNELSDLIIVNINMRKIDQKWFADFVFQLTDMLNDDFISRLGYVLADEFERVGLDHAHVRKAFRRLLGSANQSRGENEGAKVVLSTQSLPQGVGQVPCSIICDCDDSSIYKLEKVISDSQCHTQVYFVNLDELYEPSKFDLDDKRFFIRNISKYALSRLKDNRASTNITESFFVNNKSYRYFKGAEKLLLSANSTR